MKGLWVLLLVSFLAHASVEVYVWTDKQGVLHFSDTPDHPSAKQISMPDMNPPPPEIVRLEGETSAKADAQPFADDSHSKAKHQALSVRITSPTHDSTIRSNPGFIEVTGDVTRPLNIDDKLQLFFDGKPYGAPKTNPYWTLKYVDRGTHTLMIQVQQNGKVIASSDTITVHLHRTTVQ